MKRVLSLCMWGVAAFFCIIGIAVSVRRLAIPSPGLEKIPLAASTVPSDTNQPNRLSKARQSKNKDLNLKFLNDLRFISSPGQTMILTPYGPCGTVARLAPTQFGFSSGVRVAVHTNAGIMKMDDPVVHLYPTAESALVAGGRFCDGWYQQERANRSAARDIQESWQQQQEQQEALQQGKRRCYEAIMRLEEKRHAAAERLEEDRHNLVMRPLNFCCFLPSATSIEEQRRIAEQNAAATEKEIERHSAAVKEESDRYSAAKYSAERQGCQESPN